VSDARPQGADTASTDETPPEDPSNEASVATASAAAGTDASTHMDADASTDSSTASASDAEVEEEGSGDAENEEAGPSHPTFVPVTVASLVFDLPSPSPMLHLREEDLPLRGIVFPIGLPEAQSIALALEGERAPRPSSHDLLASVLVAAGCDVVAVRLTGVRGGTIVAELDVAGPRGREVLDCRPSDGIAVALRMAVPAPILADESLLE
jgi:bifunctional DNase/RNase